MSVPTNAESDAIKREYGTLFGSISYALFEADPIGINFDHNTDEYEPEAGTIIPRLDSAKSAEDVQTIVYEEFCTWFSPIDAGPREKYASVSAKIWDLWCAFRRHQELDGMNTTSGNAKEFRPTMGIMICETHGRVNFVEACSHIAKQIGSQQRAHGRRLAIMGNLFVCEACFASLGFDRFNDLDGVPPEALADVNDARWGAFEAAYDALEDRQAFCLKCVAELERQDS